MADKKVNLIISLKDGVSSGLSRIRAGLGTLRAGFQTVMKVAAVGVAGVTAALAGLALTIRKAFQFETARVQLSALLGSMGAAVSRFNELRDFSARTPFQLPDILKASRLMTVFSEGALGSAKSLQAIGDAAAVAGVGISDVAFWVGRAYSLLKGGQPFGEAAMRLQEMGILTARGRQEMEQLQKQGASFETVWARLQQEMGRFNGGMEQLSKTGDGLISTLKDNWGIALATFGEKFVDLAKDKIKGLIDTIQTLIKDGTIDRWAEKAKEALTAVIKTVEVVAKGGEGRQRVLSALGDVIKAMWVSAAEASAKLLIKAAPHVGAMIGHGFVATIKKALSFLMPKEKLTVRQSQVAQEYAKQGSGPVEKAKRLAKAEDYFRKQNAMAAMDAEARAAADAFGGAGDTVVEALKNLRSVLDAEADAPASASISVAAKSEKQVKDEKRAAAARRISLLALSDSSGVDWGSEKPSLGGAYLSANSKRIGSGADYMGDRTKAISGKIGAGGYPISASLDIPKAESAKSPMDALVETNTLLKEQNKILTDRLGGVSGGD